MTRCIEFNIHTFSITNKCKTIRRKILSNIKFKWRKFEFLGNNFLSRFHSVFVCLRTLFSRIFVEILGLKTHTLHSNSHTHLLSWEWAKVRLVLLWLKHMRAKPSQQQPTMKHHWLRTRFELRIHALEQCRKTTTTYSQCVFWEP